MNKAPWKDFKGSDIFEGSRITHPSGQSGIVISHPKREDITDQWCVDFCGCPPEHDNAACLALKQYALVVSREMSNGKSSSRFMQEVADHYHTTTHDMKKHWRCLQK